MTGIEITLLFIGVVFFIGSFFIGEKLSSKELEQISNLSKKEIKQIMESELEKLNEQIKEKLEEKMDMGMSLAVGEGVHSIEKEYQKKLSDFTQYTDSVFVTMNKTHQEIMFLYEMLNEKQKEVTQLQQKLDQLLKELKEETPNSIIKEEKNSFVNPHQADLLVSEAEMKRQETINEPIYDAKEETLVLQTQEVFLQDKQNINHKDEIIRLFQEGFSVVDIARQLSLGFGEVQLVLGLYKGEGKA